MKVNLIAAMDEKRGIGKDNALPWNIPSDLKHFKEITLGHAVIMGRKTFQSIGRPLPNRTNIIVTHNASLAGSHLGGSGVIVTYSLEEALRQASFGKTQDKQGKPSENKVFIIGGGQIFAQALPLADKLYLTIVEGDFNADTFFPDYENLGYKVVKEENGEENGYKFRFVDLRK